MTHAVLPLVLVNVTLVAQRGGGGISRLQNNLRNPSDKEAIQS